MFSGGSLWRQNLHAMQGSRNSAIDVGNAGISPTVLLSPPAVFYKAVYCLGLV